MSNFSCSIIPDLQLFTADALPPWRLFEPFFAGDVLALTDGVKTVHQMTEKDFAQHFSRSLTPTSISLDVKPPEPFVIARYINQL